MDKAEEIAAGQDIMLGMAEQWLASQSHDSVDESAVRAWMADCRGENESIMRSLENELSRLVDIVEDAGFDIDLWGAKRVAPVGLSCLHLPVASIRSRFSMYFAPNPSSSAVTSARNFGQSTVSSTARLWFILPTFQKSTCS